MKMKPVWLIGCLAIMIGCDREPAAIPSVGAVSSSGCKDLVLKKGESTTPDQDCIQYQWQRGDSLQVLHVNAGFNCCPEGFRTELKVSGDTLIISEFENSSLCDCSCLFDLTYSLAGIERKTWWIRIVEPYVKETDEKLIFKADLGKYSEGEYCALRTGYPWKL
jgi:hypothetical protein